MKLQNECEHLDQQIEILEKKRKNTEQLLRPNELEAIETRHNQAEREATLTISIKFPNLTSEQWNAKKYCYEQSFLRGLSATLREPIEHIGEISFTEGVQASAKVNQP